MSQYKKEIASFHLGEMSMMYLHYCATCARIHILSGHKSLCPRCGTHLAELNISFTEYSQMNMAARSLFLKRCQDARHLSHLLVIHR